MRPNFVIPRAVAESMTPAPNPAIPEVPPAPQLRHSAHSRGIHDPCPQPHHSRSTPSAPTSSFRAQSRNPSPASQRINQKIQRPLHSTMDTATSRSMTALVFRGQSRNPSPASQRINQKIQRPLHSTMDTATSRSMTALVFRAQSRNPSPASQRISQRSQRPLHSTMDTATSRSMTALVFRGQSRNPSPASQRISQRSQRPLHSTMDTATSRSMTALVFRGQSRNPSPASQRISQRSQRPLHSTMDTATSRSMTALCRVTVCAEADDGVGRATASPSPNTPPLLRAHPAIPEVPPAPQLRHSARSRGIHDPCPQPRHSRSTPSAPTSSFRAQSRNPSPASQRISQRSQRPLHSTMDTATSRSMTALCRVTV